MLVDEFGWSHREVMELPYKTFLAYQRLVLARRVNARNRQQADE